VENSSQEKKADVHCANPLKKEKNPVLEILFCKKFQASKDEV